jgi:hypothetical protein
MDKKNEFYTSVYLVNEETQKCTILLLYRIFNSSVKTRTH